MIYAIGQRVRVAGGYDMDPPWLAGGRGYVGTITDISGKRAVVELDHEIELHARTQPWQDFGDGSGGVTEKQVVRGRWLALMLGYVGHRWEDPILRMHVGLCSKRPNLAAARERGLVGAGIGAWVESHATMRHADVQPDLSATPIRLGNFEGANARGRYEAWRSEAEKLVPIDDHWTVDTGRGIDGEFIRVWGPHSAAQIIWAEVEGLLRRAMAEIDLPSDFRVEVEDFLDHNELGLAAEMLSTHPGLALAGQTARRAFTRATVLTGQREEP